MTYLLHRSFTEYCRTGSLPCTGTVVIMIVRKIQRTTTSRSLHCSKSMTTWTELLQLFHLNLRQKIHSISTDNVCMRFVNLIHFTETVICSKFSAYKSTMENLLCISLCEQTLNIIMR